MFADHLHFLSSLESARFEPVRKVRLLRHVRFETGKDCALVSIDPAVPGQDFGSGDDIDRVVLVARHEGGALFPINSYPLFVFIGLLNRGAASTDVITADDIVVVCWGEVYRTYEDAEKHRFE